MVVRQVMYTIPTDPDLLNKLGSFELAITQFWMHVQVPTDGH